MVNFGQFDALPPHHSNQPPFLPTNPQVFSWGFGERTCSDYQAITQIHEIALEFASDITLKS